MPLPALALAFALAASDPSAQAETEPLPASAPTQDYPLAAWCYGALSEYLDIYGRVIPELRAIDKAWGSSRPNEKEPYAQDMAAFRVELKVLAHAVQSAEQASPSAIAPQGILAINQGRAIWRPVEMQAKRKLADAWLTWTLPDRCDTNAKALIAKSAILGQALKYNAPSATDAPAPAPPDSAPDAGAGETSSTPPAGDAKPTDPSTPAGAPPGA